MNAPDRQQWLAERRSGVGGSDIAALLGLSPWTSPLALWRDKTGRAEDVEPDEAARERMHFGTVLEDVVAREHASRTGARVQRINTMLRLQQVPIALANIDRAIVADGSRARWDAGAGRVLGARGILECKTAHALARNGADWGEPGTDEVPRYYWLQVQWYMGISGLPFADLAVLFGGQRFAIYTIEADAPLFADLLAEADAWWQRHVVADTPPEPRTEDEARSMWRSHLAGRERIVDVHVADAVQQLAETKAQIAELEREAQELRDAITCAFGDAEAITFGGRRLATWKANKASTKTDWMRVFVDAHCALDVPADDPRLVQAIESNTKTTEGARVLRLNTKEN